MKHFNRISLSVFLAVSLSLGASIAAAAPPPQLEAQVSSDQIGYDEVVRLQVTLSRDASQTYQGYTRPDPKDFDILSQQESEQTQWTVMNGVQSTRTIEQHVYMLRPKHKGPSTIPPASVRINGRELKTREFVIKVGPPSKKPGGPDPLVDQNAQSPFGLLPEPEGMRGDEDVFVEAKVDKPQTYVGDQVIVTWKLFTRADILRYRTITEPKHDEFWSEDLYVPPGKLNWERQVVKGQEYQAALLLKRALFPLRAGRLAISPMEAEATTLQTAFYAGGSAVRMSKPLVLEVLPLPAAGRPDGFETPNVGHFEVIAAADNTRPKAGEAITYRYIVKGQGNLRNLKVPRLDHLEGFKVYEPTVLDAIQKTERGIEGTKVFSYLLLPKKGGELTIPPIELHFFDPALKKYMTASTPGQNITVSGDPQKIGMAATETRENVLAPKIAPLRISHHVETHFGDRLLRGKALPIALGVPPGVLFLVMAVSAVRARLRRETAGSKRRRARAAARKRMRAAEMHIRAQRPSAFFAECARSLYEHLEYRLGMKAESYTNEELRRLLASRGFDEELATAIASELENCDFARFAASASGPGEMRSALRRVRQLLAAIERAPLRDGRVEAAA